MLIFRPLDCIGDIRAIGKSLLRQRPGILTDEHRRQLFSEAVGELATLSQDLQPHVPELAARDLHIDPDIFIVGLVDFHLFFFLDPQDCPYRADIHTGAAGRAGGRVLRLAVLYLNGSEGALRLAGSAANTCIRKLNCHFSIPPSNDFGI